LQLCGVNNGNSTINQAGHNLIIAGNAHGSHLSWDFKVLDQTQCLLGPNVDLHVGASGRKKVSINIQDAVNVLRMSPLNLFLNYLNLLIGRRYLVLSIK
jgi:hypothetical protein